MPDNIRYTRNSQEVIKDSLERSAMARRPQVVYTSLGLMINSKAQNQAMRRNLSVPGNLIVSYESPSVPVETSQQAQPVNNDQTRPERVTYTSPAPEISQKINPQQESVASNPTTLSRYEAKENFEGQAKMEADALREIEELHGKEPSNG